MLMSMGRMVLPSRASRKLFVVVTNAFNWLVGMTVMKLLNFPLVALIPVLVTTRIMST